MQAQAPRLSQPGSHQRGKSLPGTRSGTGIPTRKASPVRNRMKKYRPKPPDQAKLNAQAQAIQAMAPHETFQMISDIDNKLATKSGGIFDEDAHNAKRQLLL